MSTNNTEVEEDDDEANQQPIQEEGNFHEPLVNTTTTTTTTSSGGYCNDDTEIGGQRSPTTYTILAHENQQLHQSNGNLQHFEVPTQPLVQHIEAVSPSSSLIADNDIHEHDDENHYMHSPITHPHGQNPDTSNRAQPLPPPPSEQTAREQLIERERQGRLERERARLKQRLAISRERDEEDEAFAEVDRLRESVASVENTSIDIMNLTDIDDEDEEGANHQHDVSMAIHDESSRGIVANDTPVVIIDDILSSNNEIVHNDILHNSIEHNETSERNSNESAVNESSATLPLGYTMERFLQDGVVVSSSNVQEQPVASQSMEVNQDNVIINDNINPQMPNSTTMNTDNDGVSDNDSHTNNELVDLNSEHISSSIAEMSVTAGVNSEMLSISPSMSRVASSDIGIADLGLTSSVTGVSTNRNERDDTYNENVSRLARLTEAEILELSEIDFASVGNMPPRSDRDEQNLPSIQDLAGLGQLSNLGSDQTQTTMQESMSIVSTDINVDIIQNDGNDGNGGFNANLDSNISNDSNANLDSNNISNEADIEAGAQKVEEAKDLHVTNSENQNDDSSSNDITKDNDQTESLPVAKIRPLDDSNNSAPMHQQNENDLKMPANDIFENANNEYSQSTTTPDKTVEENGYRINLENGLIEHSNITEATSDNYNLPNRVIRPGFATAPKQTNGDHSSLHRRSFTTPNIPTFVDDFDYCKYNDNEPLDPVEEVTTQLFSNESLFNTINPPKYGSIPANEGTDTHGLCRRRGCDVYTPDHSLPSDMFCENNEDDTDLNHKMDSDVKQKSRQAFQRYDMSDKDHIEEMQTLITNEKVEKRASQHSSKVSYKRIEGHSVQSQILDSMILSVVTLRSDESETENKDCHHYLESSAIERAFPERFLALLVTLIVEIPVLLMISGGSDNLCSLFGRKRYQLLMAFLPLSSAISGNCGLQASSLATRAISHLQVTEQNYFIWLCTELKVAALLGIVMGSVVGGIAFQASGFDFAFGFTIFIANFISVFTAGLTGTLAPLLFTFLFKRDAGKWAGPIETAIQDIVGSFVMVILSYRILMLIGTNDIDPSDLCGNTEE